MSVIKKKKLLFVLPSLKVGGAEKVNINLMNSLVNEYEIQVFIYEDNNELIDTLDQKINIINLNLKLRKINLIKIALNFLKTLYNYNPNIIIVNIWPLTFICSLMSLLYFKKHKYISIDHNTITKTDFFKKAPKIKKFIFKLSFKLTYLIASSCICVSHGVAKDISLLSGIKKDNYKVIPNSVSIKKSGFIDKNNNTRIDDKKIILSVGTLKKQKNHKLLLKSFSMICKDKKLLLIIVGDGELRNELVQYAKLLNIKDDVIFVGETKNVEHYYKICDIFALSSDYEGLPTVLIEAIQFGLTIVSTDCDSGPREILNNGELGYLVQCNNEIDFSSALLKALEFKIDKYKLQQAGNLYLPENVKKLYINVFNDE